MSERACKGCGSPLPTRENSSGRQRIWCSERCRKDHTYAGTCIDCGGPTDGTKSGKDREPERCISCQRDQNFERDAEIIDLWEQGLNGKAIAERLGLRYTHVLGIVKTWRNRHGVPIELHRLGGNAEEREERRQRMLEWRREGKSNAEIAELAGFASAASVSVAFFRMRKRGFDVPPAGIAA